MAILAPITAVHEIVPPEGIGMAKLPEDLDAKCVKSELKTRKKECYVDVAVRLTPVQEIFAPETPSPIE